MSTMVEDPQYIAHVPETFDCELLSVEGSRVHFALRTNGQAVHNDTSKTALSTQVYLLYGVKHWSSIFFLRKINRLH